MLVERLAAAAESAMLARNRPRRVSGHNCGACARSLWYGEHGYVPAPMEGSVRMVLDLGDALEDIIARRLEELGIGFKRLNYSDTVQAPPVGAVRADGLWDGRVVEIKSMSDYPFRRFAEEGDIGDRYRCQLEAEMRGHGCDLAVFLAVRKETGEVAEREYARDDAVWTRICATVAAAKGAACPDRPYALESECSGCSGTGKTPARQQRHAACGGTGKLPGGPFLAVMPCSYCGYREECFGALEPVQCGQKTRWRPLSALTEALAASVERE